MLGINYIKFDSMSYVICYQNGQIKREGRGLAFYYFAPVSSIVSIPLESRDFGFIFKESTQDYQEVSVQGQITYRVTEPHRLAEALDFTVDANGRYVKDDFEKVQQRILNEAQTASAAIIQRLTLKEALRQQKGIEEHIMEAVQASKSVAMLGLEIMSANVLAVKPNPEMSRALEAHTRESLQKEADQAIYERRNFAVEQERMIQESELNTEIAVEEKQRQIAEKKMETKVVQQQNEQQLREMQMEANIALEDKKQGLLALKVKNERQEADAKAYALTAQLKPYQALDWKTLVAINSQGMKPADNIALAFRELAENAGKIGTLNISPDLLESVMKSKR